MNTSNIQQSSPLIDDLLANGHEFSFSQIMRLARSFLSRASDEDLPEVPWQDRVRLRPPLSFSFPTSDVAEVNRDGAAYYPEF